MPQSLSNLLIHLVFSTKKRRPFLRTGAHRAALQRYLGGVSARLDCPVVCVGGTADHVHCLARQARTVTVAEWVKELKRVSSHWAKTQDAALEAFQWQAGYAAFSVSQSLSRTVQQYIERQEEHHRRFDFQRELRQMLAANDVQYDEWYVWD